jgi:hypothetical protein
VNPTLSAVVDHLEVARQAVETARALDGNAVRTATALDIIDRSIADAIGLVRGLGEQMAP